LLDALENRTVSHMSPLRARVDKGRLVLDEPIALPDGMVVDGYGIEAVGKAATSTLTTAAICLIIGMLLARPTQAQTTSTARGFMNVNVGAQGGSHALKSNTMLEIYGEPTSVRTAHNVGGGVFFDVSAGYKVWRNLAVGLGYSVSSTEGDLTINADTPDPFFRDFLHPVTASAPAAGHTEHAIDITGTWVVAMTDKVSVDFQFGPTIWRVSQDLPSAITVSQPSPIPEVPVRITAVEVSQRDLTTVGFHLGVDVTYLMKPWFGVGGLGRYAWGSARIGDEGSESFTLGGLRIGGGVRFRF